MSLLRRWSGALVALAIILEIGTFAAVWQLIGGGATLLALLAISVLGATVLRREGLAALRALRRGAGSGHPFGAEATDVPLLALAGMLLVVPGFLSSLLALLLLVPGVRSVVRRTVGRRLAGRTVRMPPGMAGLRRDRVVSGDVVDAEPGQHEPPPPGIG